MDWTSTTSLPNTKIQTYLNAFNDFIISNHGGRGEEDQSIKNEWLLLKKMIEKNPNNMRGIEEHIGRIGVGSM